MKKSKKRLIWALGWYIAWTFEELVISLNGGNPYNLKFQIPMTLIWLIPLIFFKDDKLPLVSNKPK